VTFMFRVKPGVKVTIKCDMGYAIWLVRTQRVVMGVWCGPGNRIYL
jgi:hypothetical protein